MAEAKVKIGTDSRGVGAGLAQLRAQMKGFAGSLAGVFSGALSHVLGGGMLSLLQGFVGKAQSILSRPLKLAIEEEQTIVALEVLTGSLREARSVYEQFIQTGASTPYSLSEVADAGRKLIAFGSGVQTVNDELLQMSDISSGVGMGIGELAELYGKARVAGTLYAEDINQLVGRGIPVIQEFAAIMGTSEGNVKKLASEGQITFPMLEEAFSRLTSEGGKFYQMSDKQSRTLGGLWSTFQDEVDGVLRSLGRPVADWLKPQIEGWIEKISAVGKALENAIKTGNLWNLLRAGFGVVVAEVKSGLAGAAEAMLNKLRETKLGQILGLGMGGYGAFGDSPEVTAAKERYRRVVEESAQGAGGNEPGQETPAPPQASAASNFITDLDRARADYAEKEAEARFKALSTEEKIAEVKRKIAEAERASKNKTVAGFEAKGNLLDLADQLAGLEEIAGREEAKKDADHKDKWKNDFDESDKSGKLEMLNAEAERLQNLIAKAPEGTRKEGLRRELIDIKKQKAELERDGASRPASVIASSLQRIGGGGGIAGVDPAQRSRDRMVGLMEKIAANTARPGHSPNPEGGLAE